LKSGKILLNSVILIIGLLITGCSQKAPQPQAQPKRGSFKTNTRRWVSSTPRRVRSNTRSNTIRNTTRNSTRRVVKRTASVVAPKVKTTTNRVKTLAKTTTTRTVKTVRTARNTATRVKRSVTRAPRRPIKSYTPSSNYNPSKPEPYSIESGQSDPEVLGPQTMRKRDITPVTLDKIKKKS